MPIVIESREQADELRRELEDIDLRLKLAKRHARRVEDSLQPYRDRQREIHSAFFELYYRNR